MLIQQLVIYGLIGLIMDYAGFDWTTSIYWCMLTLVVVSNYLARREGHAQGLEDAEDTLIAANTILDRAREEVNKHIANVAAERESLQSAINNTRNKDTQ